MRQLQRKPYSRRYTHGGSGPRQPASARPAHGRRGVSDLRPAVGRARRTGSNRTGRSGNSSSTSASSPRVRSRTRSPSSTAACSRPSSGSAPAYARSRPNPRLPTSRLPEPIDRADAHRAARGGSAHRRRRARRVRPAGRQAPRPAERRPSARRPDAARASPRPRQPGSPSSRPRFRHGRARRRRTRPRSRASPRPPWPTSMVSRRSWRSCRARPDGCDSRIAELDDELAERRGGGDPAVRRPSRTRNRAATAGSPSWKPRSLASQPRPAGSASSRRSC